MHKWTMSVVLGFACLLSVYVLTMGLPAKEREAADKSPAFAVPERAVDAEASQQIFKSMCISCHGDQLQGGIGPALSTIGAELTKEEIYEMIAEGRGMMPSFKDRLSEDEIITVTTWLASMK